MQPKVTVSPAWPPPPLVIMLGEVRLMEGQWSGEGEGEERVKGLNQEIKAAEKIYRSCWIKTIYE